MTKYERRIKELSCSQWLIDHSTEHIIFEKNEVKIRIGSINYGAYFVAELTDIAKITKLTELVTEIYTDDYVKNLWGIKNEDVVILMSELLLIHNALLNKSLNGRMNSIKTDVKKIISKVYCN